MAEMVAAALRALRELRGEKLPEGSRPGTWAWPADGIVCFHCGRRFRSPRRARLHFGATPKDGAACVQDAEAVERLRERLGD